MYKLPFKTQPSPITVLVGDEEIGILEFPKLYDLTPNERLFIKEAMTDGPDIRLTAVSLAKEIAAKSDRTVGTIYAALTTGDTEILGEYLEELINFQEKMEKSGEKRILATVTAVIKFRIAPDWGIVDTDNPEQLSPKLKSRIYEFSQKEASGWSEEPASELTEEDLGKSQMAPSIASQIGENSIGDSESYAPTKSDSTMTTLETSLVG